MIRLARAEDVTIVTSLVHEAYAIYVARNGKIPGPMQDDYNYAALIDQNLVHVLQDDTGPILGLIVLIPEPHAMMLDNVAVSPQAQHRGIGRQLIAFAEQSARAAGFSAIRLYTQDIMVENIALYSRLGFTETHRAEEKGLTRVYMSKALG
jgi:ribosomal protein S18 acetylase RimI-like enzyme